MKTYILKIKVISDDEINLLTKFVSPEKGIKLSRFKFKEDKLRGLYCDLLLRYALIKELNINNEKIVFKTNDYGKPILKERNDINFNASHSGEYVAVCIDSNPVGVDIEIVKNTDFIGIVESFFTKEEQNYILNGVNSLDMGLEKFYEVWTLKESYVKCIGKGLSIPLKDFSVIMDNGIKIKEVMKKAYKFIQLTFDPNYKMSICTKSINANNTIEHIDCEKLIESFIDLQYKT